MVEIETIWFQNLAESLEGEAIVVDAWAASLNINILLSKKPRRLIVVNEDNLKRATEVYPEAILVGESDRLPPSRFQTSNQPGEIDKVDAFGRDILWMSVGGSRVIEKAMRIAKGGVFVGSTGNVRALAEYFSNKKGVVTVIYAGARGQKMTEDKICGDLIKKAILGIPIDWQVEVNKISQAIKSFYPSSNWEKDLYLIEEYLNRFDAVPSGIVNSQGFIQMVLG